MARKVVRLPGFPLASRPASEAGRLYLQSPRGTLELEALDEDIEAIREGIGGPFEYVVLGRLDEAGMVREGVLLEIALPRRRDATSGVHARFDLGGEDDVDVAFLRIRR